MKIVSKHCPYCDSRDIIELNDDDFEDDWECLDCGSEFTRTAIKTVEVDYCGN